ncbi:RDD family protein [Paenibacillus spongiae]|uniref:RDD family protein n=1 Tax=Paenibacillus spongiae TaxID=2909671 RepID=A0ABY5S2T5_9BACL|nr:RDD family protein [Paenibacillus spongiae]UVI27758.1 RDD family protein [Paenibacillus spongiae]
MMLSIRRLLAYWIDFVLLAAVLIGFQMLLYNMTGGFPFDYFSKGYQIELWVLGTMSLPVWLYFVLCERLRQTTIGKRICMLSVSDREGANINWRQSLTRTAVKLLPWELTHMLILIPDPWWSIEEPANPYLILIPNAVMLLYMIVLFINKGVIGVHDLLAQTKVNDVKAR